MSIGEVLAAARRQAGLTNTQVSQRTRIRETIVRAIERDDFSGRGADIYARGHIRSIAHTVGVDPEPLVRGSTTRATARRGPAALGTSRARSATAALRPAGVVDTQSSGFSARDFLVDASLFSVNR